MSKKAFQIFEYISRHRFDDDDWTKVEQYCVENNIFYKRAKNIYTFDYSTFEIFEHWIADGYGISDVVKFNGKYAIVGHSHWYDEVVLQAWEDDYGFEQAYSLRPESFDFDGMIVKCSEIQRVSSHEANHFLKKLYDNEELFIDRYSGYLSKWGKYVKTGAFVCVKLFGEKHIGKVLTWRFDLITLEFVVVDGEILCPDNDFHYCEITAPSSRIVNEVYQLCLEKSNFDIKKGAYIDPVSIKTSQGSIAFDKNSPKAIKQLMLNAVAKTKEPVIVEKLAEEISTELSLDIEDVFSKLKTKYNYVEEIVRIRVKEKLAFIHIDRLNEVCSSRDDYLLYFLQQSSVPLRSTDLFRLIDNVTNQQNNYSDLPQNLIPYRKISQNLKEGEDYMYETAMFQYLGLKEWGEVSGYLKYPETHEELIKYMEDFLTLPYKIHCPDKLYTLLEFFFVNPQELEKNHVKRIENHVSQMLDLKGNGASEIRYIKKYKAYIVFLKTYKKNPSMKSDPKLYKWYHSFDQNVNLWLRNICRIHIECIFEQVKMQRK